MGRSTWKLCLQIARCVIVQLIREAAKNIEIYGTTPFSVPGGDQRRVRGGTVDWNLRFRIARCVAVALERRAVKGSRSASMLRVSELPERRTEDRRSATARRWQRPAGMRKVGALWAT